VDEGRPRERRHTSKRILMDLPHSEACFVQTNPAETAEAFCDAILNFGIPPKLMML
jgi:hypothetical protein